MLLENVGFIFRLVKAFFVEFVKFFGVLEDFRQKLFMSSFLPRFISTPHILLKFVQYAGLFFALSI